MDFISLVQQPESQRNDTWEVQFLDGILTQDVEVLQDQPQTGPDGWPYLLVKAGTPGEKPGEPFGRIVRWLSQRGIGLVVNPHKMMPDYVFTFGMLWNQIETGRFVIPSPKNEEACFEQKQRLIMGAPTEKYLPSYVRKILREFLKAQGIERPKILVVSSADYKKIDLAFSMESLSGANSAPLSQDDQKNLAEALSWFLPLHYGLTLVSEAGLPPFYDL